MVSERSSRGNLCTLLMEKLGLRDSNNSYQRLASGNVNGSKKTTQVPRGYMPMYVGEERKRYLVRVEYLSLTMFQELIMKQTDGDNDIKIEGPITLACTTETFDELLKRAKKQSTRHCFCNLFAQEADSVNHL